MSRGCSTWKESSREFGTATLSLTVSGTSTTVLTGDAGYTVTKTIANTTKTVILTLADFDPREDMTEGVPNPPPEGTFYLLAMCCCQKCRFAIFGALSSDALLFDMDVNTTFNNGDPPENDTVEIAESASASAANLIESRGYYCKNGDEDSKTGEPVILFGGDGSALDRPTTMGWAYSDSAGRSASGTGYTGTGFVPGPAEVTDSQYASQPWQDPCGESPEAWQQIIFSGTESTSVEGETQTVTTNFTIRAGLALT